MISRNITKVFDILILAIYSDPDIDENSQAGHTQKLIEWFRNTDWKGTVIIYWFSTEKSFWKSNLSLIDDELAKIISGFNYLLYATCESGSSFIYNPIISTKSVFCGQDWVNNSQTNILLMGDSFAIAHVEEELKKAGLSPLQMVEEKEYIF